MRIDTQIEQIAGKEDKPLRFFHSYHVEPMKFKEWLHEHSYMANAPFSFTDRGVEVIFPGEGWEHYEGAEFFVNHRDEHGKLTEKIPLNLMSEEGAEFVAHRDLFNQEDWIVQLIE